MRACWALWFIALAVWGCVAQPVPALVAVTDVSPRQLDVGDRLEVLGGGFPEGRRATLSLRGELHRPGLPPVADVEVVLAAEAVGEDRIQAQVTEALVVELCGRGPDADHTTFRGELVVAFAPRTAGAPPVTGILTGVVLDVRPGPAAPDIAAEREAEAERLLAFLGLEVRALPGGLEVRAVRGGGRAASAGLLAGDLILSADGVSSLAKTDLLPSGRQRNATLIVRRGRLEAPLRLSADVAGFRQNLPDGLVTAVLITAVFVVILLVLLGPFARLTTRLERRVAARLRAPVAASALGFAPVPRLVISLSLLAHGFMVAFVSFGGHFVAPELDVPVAFVVLATLLLVLALAHGGFTAAAPWSLRRGAGAALQMLGVQVCAGLSFGCSALATGGIHVGDAVRTQGGAPWNWSAAESPMLAAALLVLIASAVFVAPPRLAPEHRGAGALVAMLAITHWLNALFVAGVAAALFLGGWRMPGVSPTDPSHVLRAAGAAVFLLKTWAVLGVVLCAGWVAARSVPVGPRAHHRLRWMMPCGAIALAATALVELGPLPSLPGALRDGLGVVATAAVLAMVAGFVARVLVAVRGKAAQLNVNPWL